MAVGTRTVVAIMAGGIIAAAMIASLLGRDRLGAQLMTVGFGFASLWALLSTYWATEHPSVFGETTFLMLLTMSVTATIYYGYKAANGLGFTESVLDIGR